MSGALEHLLDFTLDMRERRLRPHQAERRPKDTVQASHTELKRRRTRFSTEVRSLVRKAVEQANHHLMSRPEGCEFCELRGFIAEPWYPGKLNFDPIAYELRVNGEEVGERLIVDMTNDGMIEARLWPFLTDHQGHVGRIELGWTPIPLTSFDAGKAEELLVLYLAAITHRWPICARR